MAEDRQTERFWDPNSKSWQTRTTFGQGQGKFKERLSSEEEAEQGVKKLFTKDSPKEEKQEDQSLGGAAARARAARAKAEGQQKGLQKY